jgi:transposase
MTIYQEIEAEIVRLTAIEGWSVGTIASTLAVHHSTVTRVLEDAGIKPRDHTRTDTSKRPSMIEPYLGFIKDTFSKYPELPASVLYHMVCKRGYPGCEDHFRHRIADLNLRPRKSAEAYLELRTLPGEQAQVDWASFGPWPVDGGQRRLSAFVMVLSYSRHIFVRFSLDQKMSSFLEGHVQAFSFFVSFR